MENSTIVALSTPVGVGGISIVRLSGKDSLKIASGIFTPARKIETFQPRYMYFGSVNLGQTSDNCLMVYFKAPHSYTGEDMVEFQCHGGTLIYSKLIDECLKNGATIATAGEFTKRAFINGKMSLDKAEAVIDVIDAESDSELKASQNLLSGALQNEIGNIQNNLTTLLAEVDVNIDYPEHDIDYTTKRQVNLILKNTLVSINNLLATAQSGKIIKDGINVVIIGKTNVGKSSLLNSMLNFDRAIVTNIEGTTRDVLQDCLTYNGIKMNLYDTAGLRVSKDEVEKIGIERAKKLIDFADVLLLVLDASRQLDNDDKKNLELIKNKKALIVLNKCDLVKNAIIDVKKLPSNQSVVEISALNKTGIEKLKQKIYDIVVDQKAINNKVILTNKRHVQILQQSQTLLNNAISKIDINTLDLIALDIKELWDKLGEITGQTANEKIIDEIFSKFCLGK